MFSGGGSRIIKMGVQGVVVAVSSGTDRTGGNMGQESEGYPITSVINTNYVQP